MSHFHVKVLKDQHIAVLRTVQAHGQPERSHSLFRGIDRQIIHLA